MKMINIQKSTDLPLGKKLLDADIVHVEGQLTRVTLRFDDDVNVECGVVRYNELGIYVMEPSEHVQKWVVSGTLKNEGVPARVMFDREADAEDYGEGYMKSGYFVIDTQVLKEDLEHNDGDEIPF